jgi:hypothetical protein
MEKGCLSKHRPKIMSENKQTKNKNKNKKRKKIQLNFFLKIKNHPPLK